ncbi:unnamed protein product [Staurois parvus]|uniref:Uncharacterized protein n=1 Tax=Staurois parvus TaxID=386267 RepID=A0ABN9BJG5_9NEOB|nr:unnamed protein product [Staurois parvus]
MGFTASHSCFQALNLPWARNTASSNGLLPGPQWCHGSLYRTPIAAVSIATTLPCATFRYLPSHCWWVPFCACWVLYGLPLLLPPPPHCGSTLWFWPRPRDCPNE